MFLQYKETPAWTAAATDFNMYDLLKDLSVIEGASFIAAPSCALHLAQMGAKVIRFDAIGGGPDHHRWPQNEAGHSLYWEGLNKGKQSIAIDLRRPEGRELATAIITAPGKGRGLFVTNYPAEGFLSHAQLSARRADLISLRIQGWSDGRNGVDYTVNAAVGVPFLNGPANLPEGEPVNSALPAWDLLGGSYGAFSLLAAERRRSTSGKGAEIRLALSDLAIGSLAQMGQVAEARLGNERGRYGNALFGAFGRDFVTADGKRCMVVAITPKQWSGLLTALDLGGPVLALEAQLGVSFATDEGQRFVHRDRLFPLIEAAFGCAQSAVLFPALEANGVCWEVYRTLSDAIRNNPRLVAANDLFNDVTHPSGETYPTPGAMARLTGVQAGRPVRAPRLGEHTEEVLASVLGLSSGEIGHLIDLGVVAQD